MNVDALFAEQIEMGRSNLYFFAYDHPKVDNKVEVFVIEAEKLDLIPIVWQEMTPALREGSSMPRLKYVGPR